jgi:hypothetical protein
LSRLSSYKQRINTLLAVQDREAMFLID